MATYPQSLSPETSSGPLRSSLGPAQHRVETYKNVEQIKKARLIIIKILAYFPPDSKTRISTLVENIQENPKAVLGVIHEEVGKLLDKNRISSDDQKIIDAALIELQTLFPPETVH